MPSASTSIRFSSIVRNLVIVLTASACFFNAQAATAQTKSAEKKSEAKEPKETLATLRGTLTLNSDVIKDVDWTTIEGSVGQLVAMQQPKLPENWGKMTPQQRGAWSKTFQESEAGKKLIASNQKKLDGRFLETFSIRDGGRFVVYDVPEGKFQLRIVAQKTVGERTYVMRNVGQFEVGEEVDELKLGEMPMEVLRLLKMGEQAPEFSGEMDNGKALALSELKGKHVLLAFGLTTNPAFKQTTAMLKEAANEAAAIDQLHVLTVTVDEDVKEVAKFNRDNGVNWRSMNLGKWDEKVLSEYGLKMVPSIWLLDAEGKIILTGSQFLFESNRTQLSIAKLVDEAISGRLKIGGEKPPENESKQTEGSDKKGG